MFVTDFSSNQKARIKEAIVYQPIPAMNSSPSKCFGHIMAIIPILTPIVSGGNVTTVSMYNESRLPTSNIIQSKFDLALFLNSWLFSCRESLKLTHGKRKRFVLGFSRNLGTVRLVNVEWRYDHDIDPLDPLKVCVLLLCSDAIYMESLAITSISNDVKKP